MPLLLFLWLQVCSGQNLSLPVGTFETDCNSVGIFYGRATLAIDNSSGLTYVNQLFLTKGCANPDAQVVVYTSQVLISPSSIPGEDDIDIYVTHIDITLNSPLVVSAFSSCDGGGWVQGQTRTLNSSCVVFGVALPSPADCPVYYSSARFNSTNILHAEFYSSSGQNITCSSSQRFTNYSGAVDYKLGGYGLPPTCEPISNQSVCAPFIDYQVSVPHCNNNCSAVTCQAETLESSLYLTVLPQIWGSLTSATCRASVGRLFCSLVYGRCGPKLPPCVQACDLTTACSLSERVVLDRLLSLLMTSTSELCSNSTCSVPPPLPSPPLPGLNPVNNTAALLFPTCAAYEGAACKGVVNYPIYVPAGKTQRELEALFQKEVWWTFGLAPKGACYKAFTQIACATIFAPCDITAVDSLLGPGPSVPVPLGRVPCRSMCQKYNQSCASFIAMAPELLGRDCQGTSSVAVGCGPNGTVLTVAVENYPVNATVLEASIGLVTYCNELDAAAEAPFQCGFPTLRPESETSETIFDSHCAVPCDSKVLNPWASIGWNRFFSACCVFSFFSALWTFTTFLVFRETLLKSQTQIYAFHLITSVFIATTIAIPVVFYDPATAITYSTCIDNTRPMTIEHPYCAYTGILMVWTTLTTGLFLTAFVLDLFLVVTMLNTRMSKEIRDRLARGTFIGIYGYTFLLVVVGCALRELEHDNLPYCFIHGWPSDLFWATLCISLVVDIGLFAWICRTIIVSFNRVTSTSSGNGPSPRSVAMQYRRPILVTFLCIILFFIAVVFRIQVFLYSDEWRAGTVQWFLCNLVYTHTEGAQCGEYPPGPDHGFLWLTFFVIFCQGLIISSIFGVSAQNFRLWKELVFNRILPRLGITRYVDRAESTSNHTSRSNPHLRQKSSVHTTRDSTHGDQSNESQAPAPVLAKTASGGEDAPVRGRAGSLFLPASSNTEFVPFD